MLASLLFISQAHAFCGTYVGGAGTQQYASVSTVALWRNGTRTVLSVANDVRGDTQNFVMVVPVPQVIPEEDVHVLDPEVFDRLNTYSEPRLVEYVCEDFERMDDTGMGWAEDSTDSAWGDTADVNVEAQYIVGEYEIVILSSEDSEALVTWLINNEYEVPIESQDMLGEYIDAGSLFFAAKIDEDAGVEEGDTLSPLQFAYDSDVFSLPIRIGTLNSPGEQDLIVYGLSYFNDGYVGIANYPDITEDIKDECMWEDHGESFGQYYAKQFDDAYQAADSGAWVREYSWGASGCDPCTGEPPGYEDMVTLGMPEDARTVRDLYFTRLHMRYTPAQAHSDLTLYQSGIDEPSQMRFIRYETFLEDQFEHCELGDIENPGSCDDPDGGAFDRDGGLFNGEALCGCSSTAPAGGAAMAVGLLGLAMVRRKR